MKKFNGFGGYFYYIKVDHLGFTFWLPFDVFESRCSLDTRKFPFDKQMCDLQLSIWSHPVTDLKIKKGKKVIKLDRLYKENSVWKLLSTDCVVNNEDSNIIFTFKAAESVSFRNYCMWIFLFNKKLHMSKLSIKVELIP